MKKLRMTAIEKLMLMTTALMLTMAALTVIIGMALQTIQPFEILIA